MDAHRILKSPKIELCHHLKPKGSSVIRYQSLPGGSPCDRNNENHRAPYREIGYELPEDFKAGRGREAKQAY